MSEHKDFIYEVAVEPENFDKIFKMAGDLKEPHLQKGLAYSPFEFLLKKIDGVYLALPKKRKPEEYREKIESLLMQMISKDMPYIELKGSDPSKTYQCSWVQLLHEESKYSRQHGIPCTINAYAAKDIERNFHHFMSPNELFNSVENLMDKGHSFSNLKDILDHVTNLGHENLKSWFDLVNLLPPFSLATAMNCLRENGEDLNCLHERYVSVLGMDGAPMTFKAEINWQMHGVMKHESDSYLKIFQNLNLDHNAVVLRLSHKGQEREFKRNEMSDFLNFVQAKEEPKFIDRMAKQAALINSLVAKDIAQDIYSDLGMKR